MAACVAVRRGLFARACLSVVAGSCLLVGAAWGQAVVSVGAPASELSNAHPNATSPVTINCSSATSTIALDRVTLRDFSIGRFSHEVTVVQ